MGAWARRTLIRVMEEESSPLAVPLHPSWLAQLETKCQASGMSAKAWLHRQIEGKIRGLVK